MAKLAPFNPTGDGAIDIAIELLAPTPLDVVYDIGCGDGRLLTAMAQLCGCKCVGIEYDGELVTRAIKRIEDANVQHLVTIVHDDATAMDYNEATIIFLYLVPTGIQLLLPK